MQMTRKTVLLIVASVLALSVLAGVAASRVSVPAPEEASQTQPTNEYAGIPDAGEPSGTEPEENDVVLSDESANESLTGDILWPEGIWGDADPADDPEEPSDPGEVEPRRPLSDNNKTYSMVLTVLDAAGDPVQGAEVLVSDEIYETDANGGLSFTSDIPFVELIVACDGYTSYYEEIDLSQQTTPLTVVLEDADDVRRILNSAELHPYVTDNNDLNHFIEVLFNELFRPGMDTYDKVKACYDWLIENTYYRSPDHWDTAKNHWLCAYQVLVDGYGTCNCYSATFTAMMRRIGLDCYVVTGYTTANLGGYTSHDWTTVSINGKWYIFDAQVEDAIANRTRSKEVTYVRFLLPEPHAKYRYSVTSRANCVRKFQSYLDEHGYLLEEAENTEEPLN